MTQQATQHGVVEHGLAGHGLVAHVTDDTFAETVLASAPKTPPFEKFGEQRVAANVYKDVIRWNVHVRPIVERLLELQLA